MDDLALWLGAQLDEDERIARSATPGPWRYDPDKHWRRPGTSWFEEGVFAGPPGKEAICVAGTGETDDPPSMADAHHIAAWDPARVLREIDAKRQLLALLPEVEQADLAEKLLDLLLAPYPKCRARTVFWPDDEACDAECVWPRGHGGTRHMDETLGGWDEGELTTSYPTE